MDVNVTGSFLVCKHAIPAMTAAGGGSIILMASQMGHVAYPGSSAYCTTKGALLQLAKGIALDHVGHWIRANTFAWRHRHPPTAPALSRDGDRTA
jgi:NAD(P)-dependent dehydrogenase (short-subunit alcohol dehydrogenase family)